MATTDVKVGTNGTCEVAPYGTALPTDADDILNGAFVDLGDISEDGLSHAFNVSTEVIRNWSGQTLRVINTQTEITFQLTFLETNGAVLELYYGAEVEAQTGDLSRIALGAPDPTPRAMVITVEDSADGSLKRYALPRCVVSDRGEVPDSNSEATSYQVTINALFDTATGCSGYILFDKDLTDGLGS